MLTSSLKRHANHTFVVFDGKVNTFLAGTNKILRLFALLTFLLTRQQSLFLS